MARNILASAVVILFIIGGIVHCGKKMTEEEKFTAAQECLNSGDTDKALKYYNELMEDYPESKQLPSYLFMKGFIYANVTYEYDKAREVYTQFLELYPESDLSDDVAFELENMGKSPELMIPAEIEEETGSNE